MNKLFYDLDLSGIEPLTSWMQIRRSPSWATGPFSITKVIVTGTVPISNLSIRIGTGPDFFAEVRPVNMMLTVVNFQKSNLWWAQVGSNHWHPRYQHGALPTELWAQREVILPNKFYSIWPPTKWKVWMCEKSTSYVVSVLDTLERRWSSLTFR